ncbi:MAG TPA: GlsB/YeaQ/YmgE family stress response membrane protein, partial [Trichococcus sp.]|nr:GlsB/YeaQ/YmgE family stress response membrane protein [Trichococcus sp.]
WLGVTLFGAWGPAIGGFYIAPALIGAIILILIVSLIMKSMRK